MTEMRILTVRQPWAWAIIHGGKDVENRVRNIAGSYRGLVAIHAAKAMAKTDYRSYLKLKSSGYNARAGQHLGEVIGVVDLSGVHEAEACQGWGPVDAGTIDHYWCSPWAEVDAHHLELANPRPLAEPIPFKGALGLRRLDENTTARELAQIGA